MIHHQRVAQEAKTRVVAVGWEKVQFPSVRDRNCCFTGWEMVRRKEQSRIEQVAAAGQLLTGFRLGGKGQLWEGH